VVDRRYRAASTAVARAASEKASATMSTDPVYNGYLETLKAVVETDRAQAAELVAAGTGLRDAKQERARVLRQTETLLAVVREQLKRAGLAHLTVAARGGQTPTGRPASAALDAANRLAAQLSATVETLLTSRAEADAQAEREAAERERRRMLMQRWALAAVIVAITVIGVIAFGLIGDS
jgi:hypothetical protein